MFHPRLPVLMMMLGSLGGPAALAAGSVWEVNPAFKVELVASEPLVKDPVDIVWDEQGRTFILSMPGYPVARKDPDGRMPGKIILAEDKDGDGVLESGHVWADGFTYASSMIPWRGGLLVANPPDLLFLRDEDGDGRSDRAEVIITGFAKANAQHNFNGLTWGLDNRLYIANGGNSGAVRRPGQPLKEARQVGHNDLVIDPATGEFDFPWASTGGHGLAVDDWGRWFGTHNLTHVSQMVLPRRHLLRNPHIEDHDTNEAIADYKEGRSARLYPVGTPETRVNHEEESGYFSAACGIMYYGGGSFGPGFDGNLFVCDAVNNLVHRMVLSPNGAAMKASRGEGEARREFMATADRKSRPVMLKTGPDGAMYVCDMYRAVIEHPEWIPDEIEKKLDLEDGKEQGRIYRVTPKGGLPGAAVKFDRADLKSVVARLADANKWTRDTAQRLLVEWKDEACLPLLEELARDELRPLGRLHALWTLEGLGRLREDLILGALASEAGGLRENALRLAESRIRPEGQLLESIILALGDADPRVRMQAVLSLAAAPAGSVDTEPAKNHYWAAMRSVAARDADDPWMRAAIEGALTDPANAATVLEAVRVEAPESGGRIIFLRQLARLIGAGKGRDQVASILQGSDAEEARRSQPAVVAVLEGLADGLGAGEPADWMQSSPDPGGSISSGLGRLIDSGSPAILRAAWRVSNLLNIPPGETQKQAQSRAGVMALDEAAPLESRLDQLSLLAFAPFEQRKETLYRLLGGATPGELQAAALEQLARGPNDELAGWLVANWKTLAPAARIKAGNILLHREANHDRLLTALEHQDIVIGQMNMDLERRRVLLRSGDAKIRERARALFSDAGVVTRAAAIERMRPALDLPGDPVKGREVFRNVCSKCHAISGEGKHVGPELTEIFRKSRETLMHDILDPNAVVNTEYLSYTVVTKEGDILSGLLHQETPEAVTLREGEEKDTRVARSDIREMYSGGLSLMPEELEKDMPVAMFADLLAFLTQPR